MLAEGINVNVTLLFAIEAYEKVAWAYIRALERRAAEGKPVDTIASVASFFVSRVDVLIDSLLEKKIAGRDRSGPPLEAGGPARKGSYRQRPARLPELQPHLRRTSASATLAAKGARVQRPLWASTSVKNKAYPDLLYAEALVGPNTVDTMPRETLDAFRDHGKVAATIEQDLDGARASLAGLTEVGIDMKAVTDQLEKEGVEKFAQSFDELIGGIAAKRDAAGRREPLPRGGTPEGAEKMGAHVGLIGLAVMGQNLALNIERNGFPIAVFNRTGARTEEFIEGPAAGKRFTAAYTLEELVAAIDGRARSS